MVRARGLRPAISSARFSARSRCRHTAWPSTSGRRSRRWDCLPSTKCRSTWIRRRRSSWRIMGSSIGTSRSSPWLIHRRWPGLTAALLAFMAITLPMLGIVQNGPQIAADRYTYHRRPGAGFSRRRAVCLFRARCGDVRSSVAAPVRGGPYLAAPGIRAHGLAGSPTPLGCASSPLDSTSSLGQSAIANFALQAESTFREQWRTAYARLAARARLRRGAQRPWRWPRCAKAKRPTRSTNITERLRIKPQYDEARTTWASSSAQQGQFDAADRRTTREPLSINPDYADAQVNWGNVLVRAGKPDDAIEHYKKALWIRPDHADAQHNWGVALAREGKLAEAIDHFKLALAIDPNHAEAKDYLARATELLRRQQGSGH